MKTKELKNLAKKIAKAEMNLKDCHDMKEREMIQNQILQLSGGVKSLEDMVKLDCFIQDFLEN